MTIDEPAIPTAPGDTLIFENDRIRVWSMTLPPGGMYDYHQHELDHLVLWPDAGDAEVQEITDADWSHRQHAEPGFALFRTVGTAAPLTPHRIRNVGDRAVTHYIVELREPSPSVECHPWEFNDRGSLQPIQDGPNA
jgi:hypothetical protein